MSPINAPMTPPEGWGLAIMAAILWLVLLVIIIRTHYRDKAITRQIGQHNYTQFIVARSELHPEWDDFDREGN